jgi:hypothetical protein
MHLRHALYAKSWDAPCPVCDVIYSNIGSWTALFNRSYGSLGRRSVLCSGEGAGGVSRVWTLHSLKYR